MQATGSGTRVVAYSQFWMSKGSTGLQTWIFDALPTAALTVCCGALRLPASSVKSCDIVMDLTETFEKAFGRV